MRSIPLKADPMTAVRTSDGTVMRAKIRDYLLPSPKDSIYSAVEVSYKNCNTELKQHSTRQVNTKQPQKSLNIPP